MWVTVALALMFLAMIVDAWFSGHPRRALYLLIPAAGVAWLCRVGLRPSSRPLGERPQPGLAMRMLGEIGLAFVLIMLGFGLVNTTWNEG